ncbi:type ISP restriction/modification enzyme [Helicobacter cetorum]|uniref:type ISP restriction/modification enzyme n=1 Tax=Helicobacter cetorum TaxID=138563 RepID=UPI000CF17AD7|nr:type ISP restriction/modification enzyme [Helicobacter cetorum]
MQFKKGKLSTSDKSIIHYNDFITLTNIPLKAYRYIVNGESAIEWIMKRYCIKIDRDSNIENNANLYSDNPRYILNLLLSVIEVSVRSVDLIESLEYKELNPSLF